MARIKLVIGGPLGTQEIPLEPKGVTLGRGAGCDIVLDHDNVSRVHARISQDPFGRWIVEDMDSRNGVLVNNQRVKAQAIQYGQTISIRPFALSVVEDTEQEINLGRSTHDAIPIVDRLVYLEAAISPTGNAEGRRGDVRVVYRDITSQRPIVGILSEG